MCAQAFSVRSNVDVQLYFINSVAIASHPPSNRKTSNSWSGSHFLCPVRERCWSGLEEEVRWKAESPAPGPFMS